MQNITRANNIKKVTILLVVAIAVVVFSIILITKEPSYDDSKPVTKEQAISLLKKGESYTNFYVTRRTNNTKEEYERIEYLYKNGRYIIEKYKKNGTKEIFWNDLNTQECLEISNNTIKIEKTAKTIKSQLNSVILDFLENPAKYEYTYVGETKINKKECVVFKLEDKNANVIWSYIDKTTGLELQTVYNNYIGLKRFTVQWNININTVTDAQVAKPDISEYSGYTIVNNT